jgi:hypothetical protein
MQDARSGLAGAFGAMSDEELLERWRGGQLTDIAVEVARAELLRRGLAAPDYRAEEDRGPDTEPDEGPHDFVVLERSLAPGELEMLRARLEGEGIPSYIADGDTNRMNPLWSIALGGTRLLVARQYEATAREVIALLRAGAFRLEEGEDAGE